MGLQLFVVCRRCGRLVPPAVGLVVLCELVLPRGVVLVGLHCSLACACGAAVGPFVRDCETERWFLFCVVRVGYWRHEPVVHSCVVASFFPTRALPLVVVHLSTDESHLSTATDFSEALGFWKLEAYRQVIPICRQPQG
ncbi:hypothetical protein Taro_014717 [Colocasia esculenta]|uniref:Uncharacterized protein n=1 Tax=Colocasia esculenta TaxID=4460 RepID=A0A843UFC1_COLES|nr:hypothetical protein [Colocasia esculenta]